MLVPLSILTPEDSDDTPHRGHAKPIAAQRGVLYDVTVDGEAVGRLKRGQTVSHEVEPGTHDVKVLFAKTGWQVPNPKTSPTMTYTVQDSETLVVNVSLGPANSPGMTAPTEEDWLSLTAQGEGGRNQTSQRSTSAIVRALLAVIVLGSFVMSLVFHPGSAVHTVSQVIGGAAAVALAYLLYRHLRQPA